MTKYLNKQYTVLYVEDERSLRDIIVESFAKFNVKVIALPDPTNQIEVMLKEGSNLDLVISDIMMPNITGLEMLKKVKAMPEISNIPWVFFTNFTDKDIIDEAIYSGVNYYYVTQDFNADQFVEKMLQILNKPSYMY